VFRQFASLAKPARVLRHVFLPPAQQVRLLPPGVSVYVCALLYPDKVVIMPLAAPVHYRDCRNCRKESPE
jgi:hypothetical protein